MKQKAIAYLTECLRNRDAKSCEGKLFTEIIEAINEDLELSSRQQIFVARLCEAHAAFISNKPEPGYVDMQITAAAATIATYMNELH